MAKRRRLPAGIPALPHEYQWYPAIASVGVARLLHECRRDETYSAVGNLLECRLCPCDGSSDRRRTDG